MDMRVEELARRATLSVDTIRFYQSRGLVPAPRRQGRVALYGEDHLERLERIRELQGRGLTLATIGRLLAGELDAADEALVSALSAAGPDDRETDLTIAQLAEQSGIPLALLRAVEREGLLIPRRGNGEPRYTTADVETAAAGLQLLEAGLPLPEVLALARQHHAAMRAVAEQAVALFDAHIRQPIRAAGQPDDDAARRLVDAFHTLLPATTALVAHHFRRVLIATAQEHIDHVGGEAERAAVAEEEARLA
jgi:DNA-binding transcriptional MerR regulator